MAMQSTSARCCGHEQVSNTVVVALDEVQEGPQLDTVLWASALWALTQNASKA